MLCCNGTYHLSSGRQVALVCHAHLILLFKYKSGGIDNVYLSLGLCKGIWPLAPLLSSYFIPDMVPGQHVYCLVASAMFWVPFYRHFFARLGGVPATKKIIKTVKTFVWFEMRSILCGR